MPAAHTRLVLQRARAMLASSILLRRAPEKRHPMPVTRVVRNARSSGVDTEYSAEQNYGSRFAPGPLLTVVGSPGMEEGHSPAPRHRWGAVVPRRPRATDGEGG